MKQQKMKSMICLCLFFIFSISGHSQANDPLKNCKQVAKKVKIGTSELTVCDRSLLSGTVTIPLSALTEELQILKLDGADAALVKESPVIIGDNYILVKGNQQIPFKLFDKKTGKFLNNIGAYGQGPNEYLNVYDQQLDEKNNRIYILPWQSKKILVYDLKGKALAPIPLCFTAPKGNFKVNTGTSTVTVSVLPFKDATAIAWTQTTGGKLLKSVAPGHLVVSDYSNEISSCSENNIFGISIFTLSAPRIDSIYHYDASQNKLLPAFTLNFKSKDIPFHSYTELRNYYMGTLDEAEKLDKTSTIIKGNQFYIIDKKTLKGSFYKLENDFLGNMEIGWPNYSFSNEYYVRNIDPGNLLDELEKVLASNKKMSPEMKAKLTKLKNSITDNDNNYILYAKLKK